MTASTDAAPLLNDRAYERLRADIISCRLAPGQLLSERKLAAELGLGIAAVRVALTRLAQLGLVQAIPRRGYQVLPLTSKSIDDLFDFWAVIGPELVGRAALGTDADVERAVQYARSLAEMSFEQSASSDAALEAVEVGGRLFEHLARMADNSYLRDAHHRVIGEAMRLWTLVVHAELQETGHRVPNFSACIDALERRDRQALVAWMRTHVDRSHERVRRTAASWPTPVGLSMENRTHEP